MDKQPFTCFIPGLPVAQGRPRFAKVRKFTIVYDPVKSKQFKKYVSMIISKVMREKSQAQYTNAIYVKLLFLFKRPKAVSKLSVYKVTKPDLDNLGKLILDAGNRIIWQDDNLIAKLSLEKRYVVDNDIEGVALRVEKL